MNTERGTKRHLAKPRQPEDFDGILIEAIDEALSSLGEDVKKSIYFHLGDLFKIERQEIPVRLNDFSSALEKIFGLGARHLEIMFMKRLHEKVKVTCKWPEYEWPLSKWIVPEMTFQKYVQLTRQKFETANRKKIEMGILVNEHEELERH